MPPRQRSRRSVPSRRIRLLAIGLALVAGLGAGALRLAHERGHDATTDLHYTLTVSDPARGVIDVRLRVETTPSHMTLGFSGNVLAPTADAAKFRVRRITRLSEDLPIDRGPDGWSARTGRAPVEIAYAVHLTSPLPNGAFAEEGLSALDGDGGRLLGSDVFLFPIGQDIDSITVEYVLPERWALHHPFRTTATEASPPNLRALYSSVVAVGRFRHAVRDVAGVEIQVALRGRYAFGDDDLIDVIRRIVAHQLAFFGDAPYDRYLFVVDEHPHHDDPELLHYFGLHFDASMVVLLDPRTDRRRLQGEPASLCAHEFFHNWLGEQLRQEDYAMNWFVEGVTTLYAYRTRLATGMLDRGRYAEEISQRHRDHWAGDTLRQNLSLAEAGSIVLQDPAITRLTYTGGLLVGIALDESIVRSTRGDASLDDVVRAMVDRAAIDPDYRLTRATLEAELERVTGDDFGPWLDRYVYGVEDVPLPGFVTGR